MLRALDSVSQIVLMRERHLALDFNPEVEGCMGMRALERAAYHGRSSEASLCPGEVTPVWALVAPLQV